MCRVTHSLALRDWEGSSPAPDRGNGVKEPSEGGGFGSPKRPEPALNPNGGVSTETRDFSAVCARTGPRAGQTWVSTSPPPRPGETTPRRKPLRVLAQQTRTPRLVASAFRVNWRVAVSRGRRSSSGRRIRTSDPGVMRPDEDWRVNKRMPRPSRPDRHLGRAFAAAAGYNSSERRGRTPLNGTSEWVKRIPQEWPDFAVVR